MTWACPECKREFVTEHTWHSCTRVAEAQHLEGASKEVLDTYQAIRDHIVALGATVDPVKTYIGFTAQTRFANVTIRKKWLLLHIGSERVWEHPRLDHVEGPYQGVHVHRFKLQGVDKVDARIRGFLEEAYHAYGLRERLG